MFWMLHDRPLLHEALQNSAQKTLHCSQTKNDQKLQVSSYGRTPNLEQETLLWILTLAGHLFATSHSLPGSWACMSRTFLAQKSILDWPMWFEWGRERLGSYKHYVRQILQGDSCTDLTIALQSSLPWNIMIAQQALIRLRRKYVALGHVDGRESRAKVQQCIFCNKRYSNTLLHVLCACPSFASFRTQCLLHFDVMNLGVLFTSPDHGGFVPIAAFAAEVVGLADDYWRHR